MYMRQIDRLHDELLLYIDFYEMFVTVNTELDK